MSMSEITKEFIEKCGSTRKAASQVARDTGFEVVLSNEAIRLYSNGGIKPTIRTVESVIASADPESLSYQWAVRLVNNAAETN